VSGGRGICAAFCSASRGSHAGCVCAALSRACAGCATAHLLASGDPSRARNSYRMYPSYIMDQLRCDTRALQPFVLQVRTARRTGARCTSSELPRRRLPTAPVRGWQTQGAESVLNPAQHRSAARLADIPPTGCIRSIFPIIHSIRWVQKVGGI
jgi:hypothetical protein